MTPACGPCRDDYVEQKVANPAAVKTKKK